MPILRVHRDVKGVKNKVEQGVRTFHLLQVLTSITPDVPILLLLPKAVGKRYQVQWQSVFTPSYTKRCIVIQVV